nr:HAD family hydrolase [Coralloluteibacterium stylophorae]
MVGFDGDDTLWRSQEFYDAAQADFERVLARYVDVDDAGLRARLYAVEAQNICLFGYGAKGMTLSMIEAAVQVTGGRIEAGDVHRIIEIGKAVLSHPVELLPGVREAVEAVAVELPIVLITKGDLFHQEAKVAASGLTEVFPRIEIVSEKDQAAYARVLEECGVAPDRFVMVGNSLRSDIAPVVALGGWGLYMPYHTTWAYELDTDFAEDAPRVERAATPAAIPAALARLRALAGG